MNSENNMNGDNRLQQDGTTRVSTFLPYRFNPNAREVLEKRLGRPVTSAEVAHWNERLLSKIICEMTRPKDPRCAKEETPAWHQEAPAAAGAPQPNALPSTDHAQDGDGLSRLKDEEK